MTRAAYRRTLEGVAVKKRGGAKAPKGTPKHAGECDDLTPAARTLRKANTATRKAREAWTKVRFVRPKDARAKQIDDVLLALAYLGPSVVDDWSDADLHRAFLSDLAAVARKYLREFKCEAPDLSRVAVVEQLERAVANYRKRDDRHSEKDIVAGSIVGLLAMSTEFGPGRSGNIIKDIQRVLDNAVSDGARDVEAVVRSLLVAYGLTADQARNAFKFRDMRQKRPKSIAR